MATDPSKRGKITTSTGCSFIAYIGLWALGILSAKSWGEVAVIATIAGVSSTVFFLYYRFPSLFTRPIPGKYLFVGIFVIFPLILLGLAVLVLHSS